MEARDELKSELSVVTFTNPNIGLTLYYFQKDGTTQFGNFPIKDHFSPESLPVLFQTYGIKYYGPHISMNRFDDQLVLSALRRVQLPERDDVYIYVESGFRLTQDNLGYSQYNGALSHLILDGEGNIVYSEIPEAMKVGENFSSLTADPAKDGYPGVSLVQGGFITEMERRFSHFAGSISAGENQWLLQILLVALFFLGFTVFLAWLLWKMVYKPLGLFHSKSTECPKPTNDGEPSSHPNTRI